MKVFITSVIRGMEGFRNATAEAAGMLNCEVKRAEDFPAAPGTPQETCLAGVRWADVVVLLLGPRYGDRQDSGLSATHEEYREARGRIPVLALVQRGVERERLETEFLEEVRSWASGQYTAEFDSTETVRAAVVRGLHEMELAQASGALDEKDMVERAKALLPREEGYTDRTLALIVVPAPRRAVLRPVEIEAASLDRALKREALTGDFALLDPAVGTQSMIRDGALTLKQEHGSVRLDAVGTIRVIVPVISGRDREQFSLALIEEDIQELIYRGLRFVGWVLDFIDPFKRLSHIVSVVGLRHAGMGWQTRAEHVRSPNRVTIGISRGGLAVVTLDPAVRQRTSLAQEADAMAEDLTVLLRREMRSH